MKQLHLVFVLAGAAAIAACSAFDQTPPTVPAQPAVPSQPQQPTVPAVPVAPAAPAGVAPAAGASAAPPKSLKAAMQGIEEDWKLLEKGVAAPATADLAAMATAADRVAAVMKLAYDPWEDKEVPDFAKLAREAEAAFLELAKKARAGDAAAIQTLGKTLQPQHCARCHDAVEQVHG